jgi:hypothetical protein
MTSLLSANGEAQLELIPDGVILLTWQPKARLEASDIEAAMNSVDSLCAGSPHPLLVNMTGTASVSRQARAVFSRQCAASRIALLGATPVDRIMATFRGPASYPCPTRFFTSKATALAWLLEESAAEAGATE